jgi:hypothetical protein
MRDDAVDHPGGGIVQDRCVVSLGHVDARLAEG